MSKFSEGDEVILKLHPTSEPRKAIVLEALKALTKLQVYYFDKGVEHSFDGWFKNKFITKT